MMESLLRVEEVSKRYGAVRAVDGLSFSVGAGELYGLIGPDGAGKTTTMRMLVTLLRPDHGSIVIRGFDILSNVGEVRRIVGYMPQRFSLYPDLTVDQNIDFFAELFGVPRDELPRRKERLYRFSRLAPFAGRLAGRLSGGMKQKLALSCTLIHNPVLLVLDEPTTGVDPVSRMEFWEILAELRREGVSIVVSTPYMDEALRCDRVAVLLSGRVLLEGDPRGFSSRYTGLLYALAGEGFEIRRGELKSLAAVESVELFGDTVHISTRTGVAEETLRADLALLLGEDFRLERIEPSLEDIFIELVGTGDAGSGGR